jgi:outer membrane protein assembly factor BamB
MAPRHRARRWLPWVGLAAVLLAAAAVAVVLVAHRREGDVSNPGVEFDQAQTQPGTQSTPASTPPRGHPADDRFEWPVFGYSKARTHVLALGRQLRPPFRRAWRVGGHVLLEFAPVLCRRSLFLLKDNGALYKISRWTGDVEWKRKLGRLSASSPACSHGVVYAVLLAGKHTAGGRIVALRARSGLVLWSHRLASRAESSPLLDHGRLYFGTEDGTVYALRASDGAVRWRFRARGSVKGALALSDGRLFFGDYSGAVYALRRADGRLLWRVGAGGGAFGFGGGHFYSSPAVQYGRVYIGSTNGAVYSYTARSGRLAWRKQTGHYVYASPAVGQVAGGPPTVWIGSYNGMLYALDARTGGVRWAHGLGGRISGTAEVLGDLVFVSSVGLRDTWALGANTGKTIWSTHSGGFNPAISDGRRIYFNGWTTMYALDPAGIHFARGRNPVHHRAFRVARRAARIAAAHRRARHVRYLRRTCHRLLHAHHRAALRRHRCWRFWARHPQHHHRRHRGRR